MAEPSVSTATSLRMMALRCAIILMPTASTTVTTAGRPSGMADTAAATASKNTSSQSRPFTRPRITSRAHTPRKRIIR